MSSGLTSFFGLSKSIWHSLNRPISSRACMPWNSMSSPSGVTISITLGTGHSLLPLFRRPHHQPLDRLAGFETQFSRHDLRPQAGRRQHAFEVLTRMVVAPVIAEGIPGL